MCTHDIRFSSYQEIMEVHIAPYPKEVGLAGNLPSQFKGTYTELGVTRYVIYYFSSNEVI